MESDTLARTVWSNQLTFSCKGKTDKFVNATFRFTKNAASDGVFTVTRVRAKQISDTPAHRFVLRGMISDDGTNNLDAAGGISMTFGDSDPIVLGLARPSQSGPGKVCSFSEPDIGSLLIHNRSHRFTLRLMRVAGSGLPAAGEGAATRKLIAVTFVIDGVNTYSTYMLMTRSSGTQSNWR